MKSNKITYCILLVFLLFSISKQLTNFTVSLDCSSIYNVNSNYEDWDINEN